MKEVIEKKKKKDKLPKDVLDIIRTTMRNTIELTNIADNKANVLLSLNALMLTFLVPLVVPYIEIIKHYKLSIPLFLLVFTCIVTIYISALVLKPGRFFIRQKELKQGKSVSPFFFGNFYKMSKEEFSDYIKDRVANKSMVRDHVMEDLHYVGSRLGRKMELIRIAFNIFMIGLFLSIIISSALFVIIPSP